jgi:hypothetical protein
MKPKSPLLNAILLFLLVIGCSKKKEQAVIVTQIEVTSASNSVTVGQTVQFNAVLKDAQGNTITGKTVSWISSDVSKAEISNTGLVTALNVGTVTITAKSESVTKTANLNILPKSVAQLSVSVNRNNIQVGDTTYLSVVARDASGNVIPNVQANWSSSDTTITKVSSNGIVTMLKLNSATITATVDAVSQTVIVTGTNNLAPEFVHRVGSYFVQNGALYYFGGHNAEILGHIDNASMDGAFNDMEALNFRVVRTWAYRDRGSLNGAVPDLTTDFANPNMAYYQYWDPIAGKPAYNDGSNGLEILDKVLAKAKNKGIKVILTLTNNWANFGGSDQYNIWYGLNKHDYFFTNAQTKKAFKDYIQHLVNRVNSVTGVAYKDDPTIFCWELINEPFSFTDSYPWRSVQMPSSNTLTAANLTAWISEMASYIKSIDQKHMVSIGNVGFLNRGGSDEYGNVVGDDFYASISLPAIDMGTFHLYIDNPARPYTAQWGVQWIRDHIADARSVNKPIIMEEFGDRPTSRDANIQLWLDEFYKLGGNGWLVWQLGIKRPDGEYFVNGDHTISTTGTTASLLNNWATKFKTR